MKSGLTELVFILDRSGSMAGLESDTIGGFNALVEKQRSGSGECLLTTVLFDDRCEILHDRVNIRDVKKITHKEYYVRGCTALLDAVGMTVARIDSAINNAPESERPEKVMTVITTDGMENASCEYTYKSVKTLVEAKTEAGWEFLFLGANIDAVTTAGRFGITGSHAVDYHADSTGTAVNYEAINGAVNCVREKRSVSSDWKKEIEKDFSSRAKSDKSTH